MILRDYQKECVDKCLLALKEKNNTLAVAPTGAGKTVILSALIKEVLKEHPNYKVLVLAHRNELISQNREKFLKIYQGASTSVVNAAKKDWSGQVVFAMEQTLTRYNNLSDMPNIDLLIIDEAHHAPADGYVRIIKKAQSLNEDALLFGVTATPNRGDKIGLGEVFDNCAYEITLPTLISEGHLVRPITYIANSQHTREMLGKLKTNRMGDYSESEVASILDTDSNNDDVVKYWRKYAHDRKTVIFCSTIVHATSVYNKFNSHGIATAIITGETSQEHRNIIFERMNKGVVQVVVNVAVLTEGWDYPPISCVVLLRMSSFKSTMIQMIGRGLRVIDQREHPGLIKADCVILDFGISSVIHGSLGQEIDLYPYKEEGEEPVKECHDCDALVPIRVMECPECGFEFEAKPKNAVDIYGMSEIDMINMSKFAWHEVRIENKKGTFLMANGFDSWSCVYQKGDHYMAIGGSNSKDSDIETEIIYKGDKVTAISKGNDFLYEIEDENAAWKSASWRHYPPSDKQVELINNFYNKYVWDEKTKGAASAIIAFQFNVRKHLRLRDVS
ncbi:MAG: DEAD/DEAH box helicase family protein [Rickettsiaceae bacterium]